MESIPVHNEIKIAGPGRARYIGWYKGSIRALGRQGIKTLCYNFMPVVDWTRTDLTYRMPSTGYALRFDAVDFAAYDLFVLQRPGVTRDYSNAQIDAAEARFKQISPDEMAAIERTLIAGLPATERVVPLLVALGIGLHDPDIVLADVGRGFVPDAIA